MVKMSMRKHNCANLYFIFKKCIVYSNTICCRIKYYRFLLLIIIHKVAVGLDVSNCHASDFDAHFYPLVLSISITPSIDLSLSITFLSSSFPDVSNESDVTAVPFLAGLPFTEITLTFFSVRTLVIAISIPGLSLINIVISTTYLEREASISSDHSASMSLTLSSSGRLIMLTQSVLFTRGVTAASSTGRIGFDLHLSDSTIHIDIFFYCKIYAAVTYIFFSSSTFYR